MPHAIQQPEEPQVVAPADESTDVAGGQAEMFANADIGLGQPALDDDTVVEIGDTIRYRFLGADKALRQVTIVDGPDDPERQVVNDTRPLTRAVLGLCPQEQTAVNGRELVIEEIIKPVGAADRPQNAGRRRGRTGRCAALCGLVGKSPGPPDRNRSARSPESCTISWKRKVRC